MILWHYDIHPPATDLRDLKKKSCREKDILVCRFVDALLGWLDILFHLFFAQNRSGCLIKCPWKLCNTSVLCNVIYPVIYKLLATSPRA